MRVSVAGARPETSPGMILVPGLIGLACALMSAFVWPVSDSGRSAAAVSVAPDLNLRFVVALLLLAGAVLALLSAVMRLRRIARRQVAAPVVERRQTERRRSVNPLPPGEVDRRIAERRAEDRRRASCSEIERQGQERQRIECLLAEKAASGKH